MGKRKEKVILPVAPKTPWYYVEVLYFKHNLFSERKTVNYQEEEAKQIYQRTINKFTESKEQAIIAIRDSNHILQISERLNLENEIRATKISGATKKKAAKVPDLIE